MVADDLEIPNESIIELRQPMSEKMDKIQHGIVECMDACLSDIKRSNTMVIVKLGFVSGATIENQLIVFPG
jgi:DNA excision repair protein ERCC-4